MSVWFGVCLHLANLLLPGGTRVYRTDWSHHPHHYLLPLCPTEVRFTKRASLPGKGILIHNSHLLVKKQLKKGLHKFYLIFGDMNLAYKRFKVLYLDKFAGVLLWWPKYWFDSGDSPCRHTALSHQLWWGYRPTGLQWLLFRIRHLWTVLWAAACGWTMPYVRLWLQQRKMANRLSLSLYSKYKLNLWSLLNTYFLKILQHFVKGVGAIFII